jgi:hypothetical protein
VASGHDASLPPRRIITTYSKSTMPIREVWTMPRDKRQKRDLHALDAEGMVLCNPRDNEAAHRAQVEGIATEDRKAVTCRKCLTLLHKLGKAAR